MPFDAASYIAGKNAGGGGGGGDITVEALSVTSNNTYTAPAGKAYSPVSVNVPNTYAAGDDGKVVSNGALVAQTAHAEVTQNGTVDTTLNNSVLVNVPSGGVKIADGTWTGVGTGPITIPLGKKMPQTDFSFLLWVDSGTEFAYNTSYKFAAIAINIIKLYSSFDLSTDGTKTATGAITVDINNEGTITTSTPRSALGVGQTVRNEGGSIIFAFPSDKINIVRDSTGFSIKLGTGNNLYTWPSGITYNWKLLYNGNDAAHDIVEVA